MGPWQRIPDDLQRSITASFGKRGRRWLERLPEVVATIAARWHLELGSPYAGGTVSLVLAVKQLDLGPGVLKVAFPHLENEFEAAALEAYSGDGAVLLQRFDQPTGAMLLEQLTPGTSLLDSADWREAVEAACGVLQRLSRPAPPEIPLFSTNSLARQWREQIVAAGDRLSTYHPDLPVEQTLQAATRLEGLQNPKRLVNQDAHLGNILAAAREPWLLIDPKPAVGHPSFDGGFLVLDLLSRLHLDSWVQVGELVERIASGLSASPDLVRDWALLRAMENVTWAWDRALDAERWARSAVQLAEAG